MQRSSDVLNASQAAEYLGAHVETVRRLARRGEIPAYKMGKDWRFRRDALERWAEAYHRLLKSAHVLVVDDEEVIREFARRVLEPEGYRVSEASTGAEALDMMRQDKPDVVLLDMSMPVMDGPSTLAEIRARWGRLPVIILTGYPDSDLVHKALQYSPITLFGKPVDPQKLALAVKDVLATRGS